MDEHTIREMMLNHGHLVLSPTGRGVVVHLITYSEISAKQHHQMTLCGHQRYIWVGTHNEVTWADPERMRVCSMCVAAALRRGWFHE